MERDDVVPSTSGEKRSKRPCSELEKSGKDGEKGKRLKTKDADMFGMQYNDKIMIT